MKKLKLRKWVKYLLLIILDLIVIFNIPAILRDVKTLNEYRFNMILLFIFFMINLITMIIIERK